MKSSTPGSLEKVVPLELKTGRASFSSEHRGQLIVYSMMMSERRPDPEAGLLLYLRNSSLQEVKAGIHEMRGLVQLRNELVSLLREKEAQEAGETSEEEERGHSGLPKALNLKRACARCGHLLACSLYQRLDSEVPAKDSGKAMAELVPQTLAHLTEEHVAFFDRWARLCEMEGAAAAATSK